MIAAPPFRWNRRDGIALAAIVAVAFLVRWLYLLQLQDSPYFAHEIMDAAIHDGWARQIAAGQAWAEGAYFRAPLYPWFLGALYRLTGADGFIVRLVQMALGSITCGAVYLLGARPFGRPVALAGGLACALYWVLIFFDGELLIASLAACLDMLLLIALMRVSRRPDRPSVAVAGLLLGLAALARPNVLVFAPAAALWLLLAHPERQGSWRQRFDQGLKPTLLLTAATLAVVLPVTIRNAVVGGDRVLIASQAGVNFYIGNNADADGMHVYLPGLTLTTDDIYQGSAEAAERELGRELKPSEVSAHYADKAWRWIGDQPGAALRLTWNKARYFWSHREILNNKDLYLLTERYTPFVRYLGVGFWLVGPLGLVGLAACRRRGREWFPIWGFVLAYMVSVVPFFVNARFRVPVLPPLTLLAAFGAASLFVALRDEARRRGLTLVGVLVLALALVFVAPPKSTLSAGVALEKLGAALMLEGRTDEALELLEESVRRTPSSPQARVTLGLAYEQLQRDADAMASYETAAMGFPDYLPALERGGLLAERLGRHEQAASMLEQATGLQTDNAELHGALGRSRLALGRYREGVDALVRGFELSPAGLDRLGRIAAELDADGRQADAIRLLRGVAEARPEEATAQIELAWRLATSADEALRGCDEARTRAEAGVRATARRDPRALAVAAAAQAECRAFDAALAYASEAMNLARRRGDGRYVEKIGEQYRAYLADRPWRVVDP